MKNYLLVMFRASFFCTNLAFCSMSKAFVWSWLWKTKIYVWQFRSAVQFGCRWQAIMREYSRLKNASFQLGNLKLLHPEVLLTFFKLLCKKCWWWQHLLHVVFLIRGKIFKPNFG